MLHIQNIIYTYVDHVPKFSVSPFIVVGGRVLQGDGAPSTRVPGSVGSEAAGVPGSIGADAALADTGPTLTDTRRHVLKKTLKCYIKYTFWLFGKNNYLTKQRNDIILESPVVPSLWETPT